MLALVIALANLYRRVHGCKGLFNAGVEEAVTLRDIWRPMEGGGL